LNIFNLLKTGFILICVLVVSSCSDESEKPLEKESKPIADKVISEEINKNYTAGFVPENMTVKEKKQRFISLLVPAIDLAYADLEKLHQEVSQLIQSNPESERLVKLKKTYRSDTDQALLDAIKPHPKSIALAQAAMESAWGTSRFFTQANNVFGVWSFDKNEPRIAAGEQRGSKTIWVKKYPDIKASISDYYKVLARGAVYKKFREQKIDNESPYELVKSLDKYSEKGDEYGKELASMIRFNKFEQYDEVIAE